MKQPRLSAALLKRLYASMLRIRNCEESLVPLILQNQVRCPVHLYTGQEAIAAGVCMALGCGDYVFGTHRSHGHYLALGGDPKALMAEIFGKQSGCSKGRGGSMHITDPSVGFLGAAPIVAGTISLALGAALACAIRKDRRVAVSFFGDGATGEGVLFESLNFAALKKLPLLFVCENNFYSTHLPVRDCRPDRPIYRIGIPFGVPCLQADGNDVLQVYRATAQAVQRCRQGQGPALIEFKTYRLHGHVGPDDNIQGMHVDIRPKEEILAWKKKDPILRFEKYLAARRVLSRRQMIQMRRQSQQEARSACWFGQMSAYPSVKDLKKYVFSH